MGLPGELVRVAEPWAALYADTPALQTAATFAHFGGLLLGGGLAVAADVATLRTARGRATRRRRHLVYLRGVHRLVLAGLAATLASGVLMLAADLEALAASPVFWAKMLLVALLLGNGGLMVRAEGALRAGATAADDGWRRLRRAAASSVVLWFAALLAGTLLVTYAG